MILSYKEIFYIFAGIFSKSTAVDLLYAEKGLDNVFFVLTATKSSLNILKERKLGVSHTFSNASSDIDHPYVFPMF